MTAPSATATANIRAHGRGGAGGDGARRSHFSSGHPQVHGAGGNVRPCGYCGCMEAAEPTRHSLDDDVDESVVLDSLRAFHAEYLRREVGLVALAVQWARLNPGLKRTMPDGSPNTSTGGVHPEDLIWEELAEKGCLHMDDLAIPVFAAAAGLSELQARKLVRESLMLVHLLPRVWHRAQEGHVEIWRVRQLADECWDLTPEAVDYVDRLMSLSTARHTQNGREGVIEEARLRYMREVVEQEELAAQEKRCFNMSTDEWQRRGVADVSGTLDLPDALDLEKAIAAGAEALRKLGSDAPLDVRRSWALGDLARAGQGAFLGLIPAGRPHDRPMPETAPVFRPDCACAMGLRPPGMSAPPSHVLMYVHLTPDAFTTAPGRGAGAGSSPRPGAEPSVMASCQDPPEGTAVPESGSAVARVQGSGVPGGMAVRPELIRSWFTRHRAVPGPKIKIGRAS